MKSYSIYHHQPNGSANQIGRLDADSEQEARLAAIAAYRLNGDDVGVLCDDEEGEEPTSGFRL